LLLNKKIEKIDLRSKFFKITKDNKITSNGVISLKESLINIDFKDFFKIKFDIFNEGVFFEYEMDQGDRIFQSYYLNNWKIIKEEPYINWYDRIFSIFSP
jgi:hypothetical protein